MRRCVLLLRLLTSKATASARAEMAIVRGSEVVSLLAWTVVVADHMPRDAVVRMVSEIPVCLLLRPSRLPL